MHLHPGFAAAAAGTITLPDYRRLLERLWGFHRPFEAAVGAVGAGGARDGLDLVLADRRRSPMLEGDLAALGVSRQRIFALPRCEGLNPMPSRAWMMGSLYVVEGSTLGGAVIARALAPVCESLGGEGRRFFQGYADQHGAMWRAFLAHLDASARTAAEETDLIEGATTTFLDFEVWMDSWQDEHDAERGQVTIAARA